MSCSLTMVMLRRFGITRLDINVNIMDTINSPEK